MNFKRGVVYSVLIALAGALPVQSALAACSGAMASGVKWHFHAVEAGKTNSDPPDAIKCVLTFKAGGNFTAPCVNFVGGSSAAQTVSVSGKLTLTSACDFTGTVTVPKNPSVTIKFGHVNGTAASGIGLHGSGAAARVMHFSMVKQ